MSQAGFLNEEELSNYLNQNLNIAVDIESLCRPTKDFVILIYTRFLDETDIKWENGPSEDSAIWPCIVFGIQELTTPFQTGYYFNVMDVVKPTKKRLLHFQNLLIYSREREREILPHIEEIMAKLEMEKTALSSMKAETELLISEAALLGNKENLLRIRDDETSKFNQKKNECDKLLDGGRQFKEETKLISDNDPNVALREELNMLKHIESLGGQNRILNQKNQEQKNLHDQVKVENDVLKQEHQQWLLAMEEEKRISHAIMNRDIATIREQIEKLISEKKQREQDYLTRKAESDKMHALCDQKLEIFNQKLGALKQKVNLQRNKFLGNISDPNTTYIVTKKE